ncbi:MAG: hypothetical protein ACXADW_23590, partial [Candidatus Hodarchaeales archaeon]
FWVRTDVTPVYWDVVGEVKIVLELKDPEGDTLISTRSYRASNVERTFTWPSKKIMEHVLVKSLEDVMQEMSSDTELVRVLGGLKQ